MPFGLKNATQAFQRLKEPITSKLTGVFVYLDDILIMSATPKQHFRHLKALCEALCRFGLVIKQDKCVLGVSHLKFLGHSVSSKGIRPLPQKVCAISEFTAPGSVKALQRFLDMINFYRGFLPGIAEVLYPLMDALACLPKKTAWLPTIQPAFCKVKESLENAKRLTHPVKGAELHLITDASAQAIGAMVQQVMAGQVQPLAFFCRRTSCPESRYSVYDLELTSMYHAVIYIEQNRPFPVGSLV